MNQEAWLLYWLEKSDHLVVKISGPFGTNHVTISDISDYQMLLVEYKNPKITTCYSDDNDNANYYLFWDEVVNTGYVFKIVWVEEEPTQYEPTQYEHTRSWDSYLYHQVFKAQYLWKKVLLGDYPDILTTCNGCNCYNDLIVTGWCYGKIKRIGIYGLK